LPVGQAGDSSEKSQSAPVPACQQPCDNFLHVSSGYPNQASTDELRAEIRAAVANHSVISWGHINLLGEYDFSDEKIRDSVGIPPPKIVLKSQGQMGGRKSA
jgi:hypothetical protein